MNRSFLRAVHDKTAGRCWYCGLPLHHFGNGQIEHQQPKSRGGGDEIENLVPACRSCNYSKGTQTVEEFRHRLLVRVETKIREAVEMIDRLEAFVEWEHDQGFDCNVPPEWLVTVARTLSEAAQRVITSRVVFFGELSAKETAQPHPEILGIVVQAESIS